MPIPIFEDKDYIKNYNRGSSKAPSSILQVIPQHPMLSADEVRKQNIVNVISEQSVSHLTQVNTTPVLVRILEIKLPQQVILSMQLDLA